MTSAESRLFFLQDNQNNKRRSNTSIAEWLDRTSIENSCGTLPLKTLRQRSSPTSICGSFIDAAGYRPSVTTHSNFLGVASTGWCDSQSSSHTTLWAKRKNLPITNFLVDFISERRMSSSSSSSSSSSPVSEELIQFVTTPCLEAEFKFSAQLRHPTTDEKWDVSDVRDNVAIEVGIDSSENELYGWKLSEETYVFGFQGTDKVHYVRASESGSATYPYLALSSEGEDPSDISDPENDYRCFTYKHDDSSNVYHLHPTHEGLKGHWIGFDDSGKLLLAQTPESHATSWLLNV